MRVIKPQRLSLLTRVFENDGQSYLVITAMGFFAMSAPRKLLHEVTLWKMAWAELGKDGLLDAAMTKHRGEVLVRGSAFAKDGVATPATTVRLTIASVDKELLVIGDRVWQSGGPSDPAPFVQMPLSWERAFGGEGCPENPLGKGVRPVDAGGRKIHPLPNIESPKERVRSPNDRPAPAGLGPIDQTWPQRMQYVGTYDQEWLKTRFPGFASDLRWEYFNTAPEDQRISGYFAPDEAFRIEGMHPSKRALESRLPGAVARLFAVTRAGGEDVLREASARLDTVILFPNIERGVVVFRGVLPIDEDDGADVLQVIAAFEDPAAPRSVEHYRAVRDRRLDKGHGALHLLNDDDLMPPWKDAGEPLPEDAWNDMEEVLASEDLRLAIAERRRDRHLEGARKQWIERGLDPAELDKKTRRPKPPPKDVAELPAYFEEMERERDLLVAQSRTKKEEAIAEAREKCKKLGLDFDKVVEQRKGQSSGPPRFSADKELERLRERAQLFRNAGKPAPALEAQIADPALEKRLREIEGKLQDAYRRCAHLFPPAGPRSPKESARIRELVQRARSEKQSLAGGDFTGVDLSGLDLSGLDLSSAFLERANLVGAILTSAKLSNATLTRANLTGARLDRADLRGANMGQADLTGADLTGSDMTEAVCYEADLRGARLAETRLQSTTLHAAKVQGVDLRGAQTRDLVFLDTSLAGARFQGADLTTALFIRCDLESADFTGAKLPRASFVSCSCDGATFAGADLAGARFVLGCSLAYCDFKGARLHRTLLRGAKLPKADLSGVVAPECDFSEADLTEANLARLSSQRSLFVRTILRGANLTGADLMLGLLQKAELHGADLRGANLFRADMAKVRGDKDTRLDGAYTIQVRTVPEKGRTRIVP